MNREIKFRSWYEGTMTPKWTIKEFIDSRSNWYPPEMEVMQYTDLKDNNGVEIYEGDIVQGHNNAKYGGDGTYPTKPMVVQFDNGMFTTGHKSLYGAMNDTCTTGSVEVIGNIYENQELLKQG